MYDEDFEDESERNRPKLGRPIGSKNKPNEQKDKEKQQILDIIALARNHTEDAIETLAEIMQDRYTPGAARVAAANSLIDRGWGKAPQTINVGSANDPKTLSDADLAETLRREVAGFVAGLHYGDSDAEDNRPEQLN